MIKDFYATTEQIANRFGVSEKTLKRWIRKKDFPAYQETANSPYMAYENDIKEWLNNLKSKLIKTCQK